MTRLHAPAFGGVFERKRVLVTGHTGFKGSWISEWLLSMGAQVAGYSIDIPTQPALFDALELAKRLDHTFGDVRDGKKLQSVFDRFQPEYVFHLAAQPIVRASYDDPVGTFETNVMGTVQVMEAIRRTPSVRVGINVTSDKCYENFERPKGYREGDHLGGKDPYSASKGAAEIVFGSYARSFFSSPGSPRLGSVRAGNVIGGGDWAKDRIVPDCARAWSRGETVTIRSPQAIRPWQHVLEPLSGYLWLAAQLAQARPGDTSPSGEAFNFGPAEDSVNTVEVLLHAMKKQWNGASWKVDATEIGNKKEASILMLNCEKAAHLLGWKETLSFDETVSLTTEWYRDWAQFQDPKRARALTVAQIQRYQELGHNRGRVWASA